MEATGDQITVLDESTAYVPVAEFYAGKSVFITGVTGFLGKVFLEKLLYSCKDVANVYVLFRSKKGVDYQQRMQELLDKPIFSRIRRKMPQNFKKIIPVCGDISQPELGISKEDEELLLEKVSVVFHIAALIKFHEELSVSVNTNVIGTKNVLNLCHRMKNIKAFIYVSTSFCNTDKKILEEKIYPPPAELEEVMAYMKTHLDEKQKVWFKGHPNTYTFTKALAEHYIAENHGSIPTVIIRPSIVTSSLREPLSGWVDNWAGATGLLAAIMKGAVKVVPGDPNNVLDIIPVDYVANLLLVSASRCTSTDDVMVFNCCTSSCNPLKLKEILKYMKTYARDNDKRVSLLISNCTFFVTVMTFLLQTVPAFAADLRLRATGKKPRYMKLQSKVCFGRDILTYFTTHTWEMRADHVCALHASLSAEDRETFVCEPSQINWDEYMHVYFEGIERLLNSKESSVV